MKLPSWSDIKKGIELAEVCSTAFDIIRDLIKHRPGTSDELLSQIGAIVTHVQEAWAGNITPAEAREAFAKLKADIAQNNADVDAAADEKFGSKG